MTLYAAPLLQRFSQTLQDLQARVTKLETRTGVIDSGFPVATLPAVIDPSYSGSGNPSAFVNGSAVLSGPYAFASTYTPVPGDQVLLQPVGANQAYVITASTAAGWQNMTLLASWGLAGAGYAQYKAGADNRIFVRGANIIPGTTTGGTSVWTPPAGYAPTVTQRLEMIIEVSTGTAGVDTPRFDAVSSGFQCWNIPASTTRVGFNGSYALD